MTRIVMRSSKHNPLLSLSSTQAYHRQHQHLQHPQPSPKATLIRTIVFLATIGLLIMVFLWLDADFHHHNHSKNKNNNNNNNSNNGIVGSGIGKLQQSQQQKPPRSAERSSSLWVKNIHNSHNSNSNNESLFLLANTKTRSKSFHREWEQEHEEEVVHSIAENNASKEDDEEDDDENDEEEEDDDGEEEKEREVDDGDEEEKKEENEEQVISLPKPLPQLQPPKLEPKRYLMELANLKDNNGQGGETTSVGRVVMETRPDWAPIGVQHFTELVAAHFYNDCRFFRVLPKFVVQFGMHGKNDFDNISSLSAAHTSLVQRVLRDDPVKHSNTRGTMTFATSGPHSRTTQLFINKQDTNQYLDAKGFAPFAMIVDGMEYIDLVNDEYKEKPNQGKIWKLGNAYLNAEFPRLSYIISIQEIPMD